MGRGNPSHIHPTSSLPKCCQPAPPPHQYYPNFTTRVGVNMTCEVDRVLFRVAQRRRGFQALSSPSSRSSRASWHCCSQKHSIDLYRKRSKRSRVGHDHWCRAVRGRLATAVPRNTTCRLPPARCSKWRKNRSMTWKTWKRSPSSRQTCEITRSSTTCPPKRLSRPTNALPQTQNYKT